MRWGGRGGGVTLLQAASASALSARARSRCRSAVRQWVTAVASPGTPHRGRVGDWGEMGGRGCRGHLAAGGLCLRPLGPRPLQVQIGGEAGGGLSLPPVHPSREGGGLGGDGGTGMEGSPCCKRPQPPTARPAPAPGADRR